ncbi:MAG: putative membrane protein [Rhodobacteraceae bacterium HLUCCO07]|nr:MAG: putative membrane protein [Rhodobacteraceae bacterium HLUCCO07]
MGGEEGKLNADTKALLTYQSRSKSTGLAYVLWFFMGAIGIHRFYLGSGGIGILVLLCTLSGVFLLFPLIVTACVLIYDLFTLPSQVSAHNQKILTEIGG